jgi:hypothetical protein
MAAFSAGAGGSLLGAAAAGDQRALGVIWAQEDRKNLAHLQRDCSARRGLIERSTLSSKAVYALTDPVFELWITRNGKSLLQGAHAVRPPVHRKAKHR